MRLNFLKCRDVNKFSYFNYAYLVILQIVKRGSQQFHSTYYYLINIMESNQLVLSRYLWYLND